MTWKKGGHVRGDSYSQYSQTMSEAGNIARTLSGGYALGATSNDNVFGVRHMKMLNEIKKEKTEGIGNNRENEDEKKEETELEIKL